MARIRSLKPGFFSNELLAECSPLARLLFAGLWCWADKEGRIEDRPRRIKAEILPYDDADVDALLDELAVKGFILRYAQALPGRENSRLIQVVNFRKHQKPHPREPASEFPEPPAEPGKGPAQPGKFPARLEGGGGGVVSGSGNGDGSGEGEDGAAAAPAAADPPSPLEEVLTAARRDYEDLRQDPWDASEKARTRDAAAAAACLESAGGSVEEVGIRWRTALVHKGWPRINTLRELEQHWAHFGNGPERARQRLRQMQAGGAS